MNHSIDFEIFKFVDLPAGPSYLQEIHFAPFSQPKVHAQIVLGEIASAATDFVHLLNRLLDARNTRNALDARANAAAV